MLDKTNQAAVESADETATHSATDEHDPYENVAPEIVSVLEKLRELLPNRELFPNGVPFKLEVTSGVARERLTLNPNEDEVFMIKKKPPGSGRRKVEIDIMSEDEAKEEIENPGGSSSTGAPAVIDPCCWWEWNGIKWVCVGYGD
jgi:hypothetical protein